MPNHRLTELDALRGLAALAVVGFHYTTRYEQLYGHSEPLSFALPWGKYGVDLFFAISGFVIFMTLDKTRRPLDFVVSRFSRLYPAYWAAMLLTTFVVWAGEMRDLQIPFDAWLRNIVMVQDAFWSSDVDGVYWTLGVELSFYACMFALYLLGALRRIEPILIGWIAMKWLWWKVPHLPHVAGYFLLQRDVPFFAIGICAYRLFMRRTTHLWAGAIVGFAIATVFAIDGESLGIVALVVAGIFLCFVSGGVSWLRARPAVWAGTISYALYLLHENIGWTVIHWAESLRFPPAAAIGAALLVILALASGVTFLIEKPAMRWIRQRYRADTVTVTSPLRD